MNAPAQKHGPLHGVRILELSHIILGPMACEMLGDLGADVVKIEAPTGDGLRTLGATKSNIDMASLFLACNRNKRSLVLDLKNPAARKVLLNLAKSVDVVLHNNRPQVMTKLGLDYAAFKQVNPSIIYCGAYGYSIKGPYGERGAMDEAVQAATGHSLLNQHANGVARSIPTALADKTTAMTTVYAVLGALFHRARTGRGQEIEVPMFETLTHFVMAEHQAGLTFDPPVADENGTAGGFAPLLRPEHKPFPTLDGYVALGPLSDAAWQTFCARADRADLTNDPRFATAADRDRNSAAAHSETAAVLAKASTAAWIALFDKSDVSVTRVNSLEDLMTDPHLEAVDFWKFCESPSEGTLRMPACAMDFSETPAGIRRPPPRLGEHSFEILRELGLSENDIQALVTEGATIQAS